MDARRTEHHLRLHARQLLPFRQPDVHGAGNGRLRDAGTPADRRAGVVLPRRLTACLHAACAMAARVEALSRRPDDADLDCESRRLADRTNPAREFQRLQPDVGRDDDLLPVGSERSREPVRVRHQHEAGQGSRQERRARLQVRIRGTRRHRHRAVRRSQVVRHGDANRGGR